jgi:hypothetical protein
MRAIMDWQEGLSPTKATKLLEEAYQDWERKLAERRFWEHLSIINGTTRKVRPEYFDLATGRKVAAAVQLMEIIHNQRIRWNKAELKILFNKQPESGQ